MTAISIPAMRQRIDRRFAILALLLAGLIGTGAWSLATVTDQLFVTNNIAVLTIDLQASTDGSAYQQSITRSLLFEGSGMVAAKLELRNSGNGEAVLGWSGNGTGSAALIGAEARVYEVASLAACDTTPSGTNLNSVSSTVASSVKAGAPIVLAPGESIYLCSVYAPNVAPAASDTATETITFSASSTLGTQ